MTKKKFKIKGITMSVKQWFNMMTNPYKEKALEELKDDTFNLNRPVNSLEEAINRIPWDTSKYGRSYWEPIHMDLHHDKQGKYMDYETITQLVD